MIILLFIIGRIITPLFFSTVNISNLLSQCGLLGLLALAQSVVLITGNFDLTIEETMIFTGLFGGWLVTTSNQVPGPQLNPFLGVILMVAVGATIGLINGLFIGYLGMNGLMGTLSMLIVLRGVTLIIFRGQRIFPFPDSFNFYGIGRIGNIPIAMIGLIIIFLIFHFIFTRTVIGRSIFAVGGNRTASRAIGINDKQVICIAYIMSGGICGLAGWTIAGKMGSASSLMSSNMLLLAFAAAVIGGISLRGGLGTLVGVFGGTLLMVTVSNIMNMSKINPYLIDFFVGVIIIIALLFDNFRIKIFEKFT